MTTWMQVLENYFDGMLKLQEAQFIGDLNKITFYYGTPMPESYLETVITWPTVDSAGPATRRETRIGKGDGVAGTITWGEWRNHDLSGITNSTTHVPASETVRNYHGRKIATEVRDFNYSIGSETAYAETTLLDTIAPQPPGGTGIVKENQPNNYVKVTFNFAPAVDWQLVVSRRIKIWKYVNGQQILLAHNIKQVSENTDFIIEPMGLSSTGYTGHMIEVAFIDNHNNESSFTQTTFDTFGNPEQPLKPFPATFGGFAQVPGPEFGGQP